MPSLGADMETGTLLEWLVKPGDPVHRGDVIAVVDTDKAAIDVECFTDGVIEQLIVEPGRRVPVGTVLAIVGAEPAGQAPAPGPAGQAPAPGPAVTTAAHVTSPLVRRLARDQGVDLAGVPTAGPGGVLHRADVEHLLPRKRDRMPAAADHLAPAATRRAMRASPMARRLAAAAGIDIATVAGSGRDGEIRADDVRRATQSGDRPAVPNLVRVGGTTAAPTATAPTATAERHPDAMRQAIASLMTRSNREIPHYYLTTTIDMTAATAWLRARNRELPVSERVVVAALLLAATARAARRVPEVNGVWVDGELRPASSVELGLVVSLRRGGIIVPVIADAAARSVDRLMATMRDVVERARTGHLKSSELTPPSITVSNLGDQGVESVLGVIYPPQVALVGFGAVLDRPWAVDGMLGVRPVVTASLAADHRASDGAVGARFLNHIDRLLQRPEEL
jgi:pyruvate dehydrogenase E2 component (dihydrolipoamide acetyltransferase)